MADAQERTGFRKEDRVAEGKTIDKIGDETELFKYIYDKNLNATDSTLQALKRNSHAITLFLDAIMGVAESLYSSQHYDEAVKWYMLAAREGHAMSQSTLGYMYLNGYGVEKSDVEAIKWFRKSADQKNSWGLANMGYMYRRGTGGVPKDLKEAKRLLTLSADSGLPYARQQLDEGEEEDQPPIFIAIANENIESIRANLKDVNLRNKKGETPFQLAISKGNLDVIELLANAGADPNIKDDDGNYPLMTAIDLKRKDIVEVLMKLNAEVNSVDREQYTPLIHALKKRQPEIVTLLLEAGADINKKAADSTTALHWSIPEANLPENAENLKLIVNGATDINAKEKLHGFTPLMLSLDAKELLPATILLIEKGADVNAKDVLGNSPLMVVATGGEDAQLRLLLQNGAKVDELNIAGLTALMLAVESENLETVNLLVKAGADVRKKDSNGNSALTRAVRMNSPTIIDALKGTDLVGANFTALIKEERLGARLLTAVSNNNTAMAKKLIKSGANLEIKSDEGKTPLQVAIERNHQASGRLLIKAGADFNTSTIAGFTPLIISVQNGNAYFTQMLINSGVNVDEKDKSGRTALLYAVGSDQTEDIANIITSLIRAKADVDVRDSFDNDALSIACSQSRYELMQKLLKAGAKRIDKCCQLLLSVACSSPDDVRTLLRSGININDAENKTGLTALHVAAQKGRADIAEILIESGANGNLIDSTGATPLIAATLSGNTAVVKVLVKAKVNLNEKMHEYSFWGSSVLTALHIALQQHDDKIAEILINAGADPDSGDADGNTPLMLAAYDLNVPLMTRLLQSHPQVNVKNRSGRTALMNAVIGSPPNNDTLKIERVKKQSILPNVYRDEVDIDSTLRLEAVNLLLKAGADPEVKNQQGLTALMFAAKENNPYAFRLLLDNGANVNAYNDNGESALIYASEIGSLFMVKTLLAKKAAINQMTSPTSIFAIEGTALMRAISKGHSDVALTLLDAGADFRFKNKNGRSALILAAIHNDERVLNALVKLNIDVNDANGDGETALLIAASLNNTKAVEFLLSAGANVEQRDIEGNSALILAANQVYVSSVPCMEALLKSKANLEDINIDGENALHAASASGNSENVEFLLKVGAIPDSKDKLNRTAIFHAVLARDAHYAIPYEGAEVIKLLARKNATINTADNDGTTPLMEAARKGYSETVNLLLRLGAKVNARTKLGNTALLEVINAYDEEPESLDPIPRLTPEDQAEVVLELVKGGADVNIKSEEGITPLMKTAFSGQLKLVKLLIRFHASLDVKNEDGWTALMFAAAQGNTAVVTSLVKANANIRLKNNLGQDALALAREGKHSAVMRSLK